MKRFLTGGTASVAKKVSGGGSAAASAGGDPVKLACWNVQSLCAERGPLALHMDAIADWVEEKIPDVLFLSEVKLIAASDGMGGRKQSKQATPVDMPSTFSKARAKGAVAEHKMVQAAFDSDGCFADYKLRKLSLDPLKKNAGTAMLTRKQGPQPTRVWTYLPDDLVAKVDMKRHNPDGRIILAEYTSMLVLHTYTPNSGDATNPVHLARRRDWDCELRTWLSSATIKASKPVVYCGDLNVAPSDIDLTDPVKFHTPSFFSKRLGEKHDRGAPGVADDDAGQPGCTPNERKRFFQLLAEGGLFDGYRECNPPPQPSITATDAASDGEGAAAAGSGDGGGGGGGGGGGVDVALPQAEHCKNTFSWRGAPGPNAQGYTGPYFRHGMRIDHFLLSNSLKARLESCTIEGQGESHGDPSFMGSDHCPMLLTLKKA